MSRKRNLRSRKGAALIIAVMVATFAAAVAWQVIARYERWPRLAENAAAKAQAEELANSAIEYARAAVYEDYYKPTGRRIGDRGPASLEAFPVENGELVITIDDEQGRFNVNSLVVGKNVDARQLATFTRLLHSLNLPATLADSVVDWLDPDDAARPNGAEGEFYRAQKPPVLPANAPVASVGELRRVRWMNEKTWALLSPHLTALPIPTRVNVNSAGPVLLTAIIPGLPLPAAKNLVEERSTRRFDTRDELINYLPPDLQVTGEMETVFKSEFYRVNVTTKVGRAVVIASAALEARDKTLWPLVIWRRMS